MSAAAADTADQIPEKMQAVICHGPENYALEQVAVPTPGPGEALVKVEAVGICASDLKCYHGRPSSGATRTGRPGPRPRSSPATSSSEQLFSWTTRPLNTGASPSATGWSASRSCRAGSAATAWTASTGCADRTTCSASSGVRPAPWRSTWCIPRTPSCTRSPPICRRRTRRSPSRCPAPCTRSNAPTSSSTTSWSSPAAVRSGSA